LIKYKGKYNPKKSEENMYIENNKKRILKNAYRNKGLSLFYLSNPTEALIYFDKALFLDPNDYRTTLYKANTLNSIGLHEEAIILYDKIIEIFEADQNI
jgi:tetratricopeptide (TPR) repeat protein